MDPSRAIAQLIACGMTEQVIAAAINVNQATINRIRRGVVTPSYVTGKALVDMAEAQRLLGSPAPEKGEAA